METITPRIDIAFKKIFGVEENKDLLISFINSIVGSEDQISEVTLLNPYNIQSFKKDKLSILDIKAKGQDGKRFNIEIQISDEADYDKRALYYWAKLYTEQLKSSEDYSTLSKAIGIHILNFTSIFDVKKYHNVFHITEKESGLIYFKDLELHTLELKKFSKDSREDLQDILKKIRNSLDLWMAFLTRHDLLEKDRLPKSSEGAAIQKALGVLETMNFRPEERETYEDRLKWLRIEANTLKKYEADGFEKGKAEGVQEGIEKGKAEGKAEGIQEGMEKGKLEGKLEGIQEVALNFLNLGLPLEKVSEATGLSVSVLEELKKSTNTRVVGMLK